MLKCSDSSVRKTATVLFLYIQCLLLIILCLHYSHAHNQSCARMISVCRRFVYVRLKWLCVRFTIYCKRERNAYHIHPGSKRVFICALLCCGCLWMLVDVAVCKWTKLKYVYVFGCKQAESCGFHGNYNIYYWWSIFVSSTEHTRYGKKQTNTQKHTYGLRIAQWPTNQPNANKQNASMCVCLRVFTMSERVKTPCDCLLCLLFLFLLFHLATHWHLYPIFMLILCVNM